MPRRPADQMRPVTIVPHVLVHPEGSALIALGDTQVICTASVEARVPGWMSGRGRGWVTAEYDMLPRATHTRSGRDAQRGRPSGRTLEIGRLLARSLRQAVDPVALGERTVIVDCDVVQADGGTRTAAITGGYVALALALMELTRRGQAPAAALKRSVQAISVGLVDGAAHLDLDYALDSRADVDMNIVMSDGGTFIELQGTAEAAPFGPDDLDAMCRLARGAQPALKAAQDAALQAPYRAAGLWAPRS